MIHHLWVVRPWTYANLYKDILSDNLKTLNTIKIRFINRVFTFIKWKCKIHNIICTIQVKGLIYGTNVGGQQNKNHQKMKISNLGKCWY
jgi:hypothetical protein